MILLRLETHKPEASAAPKKVVKVTCSTSSVVTGGMDGLPREDTDILSDVLKCLGDNRKHMREFTLSTLDTWPCAAHPDKMNNYESGEFVSSSITLESSLKTAKPNGIGDRESQHGSRNAPSRVVPNMGFRQESILSFQDINIQYFCIKPALLRESSDWKVRLESIESVTKILEEVSKRVLLAGTANVRKAAEAYFNVLRVCGQETVSKNLRDIQGSALAIISKQLKPYRAFQDNYESGGYVLLSITAESILKTAKPNGHGDRESWHGSRNAPSELAPNKGFMQESILSVQDIDIQS
ncbi:hypothetical protein SASPL_118094 [Salvia splendens]|uniref:Cytoskeleton-associated protein 5 n=1 Tax=Salvia splendens TaxID=180675 RepID=A0A8X8XWQ7_SALSN|nr:hypothetical protein SASPL_118094 [Salvia splendens]